MMPVYLLKTRLMMKNPLSQFTLFLALIVTLAPFGAKAADTAELKVKGTIRPPGCTPSLAAGGTADFGVIPMTSLNTNSTTTVGQRNISFSIACTAKMKLALVANDNRKPTVISGAPAGAYGLGAFSGKNIGYYSITVQTVTGDGSSVTPLLYNPGSGGLEVWTSDGAHSVGPSTPASWGSSSGNIGLGRMAFTSSGSAPSAYQMISGVFVIQATIDRSVNLPSSQEIPLDGSATIEVQYL